MLRAPIWVRCPTPIPAIDLRRRLLLGSSITTSSSSSIISSSNSKQCTSSRVAAVLLSHSTRRTMLPGGRRLLPLLCPRRKVKAKAYQEWVIRSSLKAGNSSLLRAIPSLANIFIPPCSSSSSLRATRCRRMATTLTWRHFIRAKRPVRRQRQCRRRIPLRILRPTLLEVEGQETTVGDRRRRVGDGPKRIVVTTAPAGVAWNTAKIGAAAVATRKQAKTAPPPGARGRRAGRSRHRRRRTQDGTDVVTTAPQVRTPITSHKAILRRSNSNKAASLRKVSLCLSWDCLNNALMASTW
jgi:hypothetical protein